MTMAAPVDDVPLPEPTETPRIGGADAEALKKKKSSMQKVQSKMRKSMDKLKKNASIDLSSKSIGDALRRSISIPRTAVNKAITNGKPPATPRTTPTESAQSSTANLQQKAAATEESFISATPTDAVAQKAASPYSPASDKVKVTAAASAPLPSSPMNVTAVATAASDKATSEPPASPAPPSMPDAADDSVVIEEEDEEEAAAAAAVAPVVEEEAAAAVAPAVEEEAAAAAVSVAPAKKTKGPLRKALGAVVFTALVGGSVAAGVAVAGRAKKSA